MRQATRKLADAALPVDSVVRCVVHALTARRPSARYPVGLKVNLLLRAYKWIPDRIWDWIVQRSLGLPMMPPTMSIRNLDKIFDPATHRRHRGRRNAGQRRLHGLSQSHRLRLPGRGLSGQSPSTRSVQGIQAYPGYPERPRRRRSGRDLHAGADRAAISCGRAAKKVSAASSSSRPGFARRAKPAANWKKPSAASSASSTACGSSDPTAWESSFPGSISTPASPP